MKCSSNTKEGVFEYINELTDITITFAHINALNGVCEYLQKTMTAANLVLGRMFSSALPC
jgi:hypothetical protein